jgi:MoaA/NifB/PqqE/SkfB family radical SAM enzyme
MNLSFLRYYLSIIKYNLEDVNSIDLLITTRCPLKCNSCIYGHIKKEDMPKKTIDKIIRELKKIKYTQLRISGGEPFAAYDNLVYMVKEMNRFDYSDISIVTSCYWSTSENITRKFLKPLKRHGLKRLYLSIDEYHLNQVPLNNYVNCMKIAKEMNIVPLIIVRNSNKIEKIIQDVLIVSSKFGVSIEVGDICYEGLAKNLDYLKPVEELSNKMNFRSRNKLLIDCRNLTFFPGGDVHFCCIKKSNTKIGNVNKLEIKKMLRKFFIRNYLNILRLLIFILKNTKEDKKQICNICPLKA